MAILHRVVATSRPAVAFFINGEACRAMAGDTVLTAVLTQRGHLRRSEFDGAGGGDAHADLRAGFCLMGACHDCWVRTVNGPGLRACSTLLEPGMHLLIPSEFAR